ncbi:MAG: tRNA (adenosine(37)-N6)-dimethylallyltransferase MiaA [Bacteroidales bacterium]
MIILRKTRQINGMILNKTNKTLAIITGPTAVGKTDLSIDVARALNTGIISADARQFYRELKIGTAAPTKIQCSKVPHYFIGHLSMHDYYNVSLFEQEALKVAEELFSESDYVVVTGGSGLYIDTLCHGIDELPDPDPGTREKVQEVFRQEGLPGLRQWLRRVDPAYYAEVDPGNPKRMIRAIEVFLSSGTPFSVLRKSTFKTRSFRIRHVVLDRPRPELFSRINQRTSQMVDDGLIEESLGLYPYRHLNALNTVGYKEVFSWLDNQWSLKEAVEKIRTNTRRYAKRQLTWFRRYEDAAWIHPEETEKILDFIRRDN